MHQGISQVLILLYNAKISVVNLRKQILLLQVSPVWLYCILGGNYPLV